jgi:endonuclease/exonuclease/phosphatase family metal-dependent hydrolase
MITLLGDLAPDVLGAQEGLDHQLADLMAGLGSDYALISAHRGDGDTEENSAIIYRRSVIEPVTVEHRWLSDTPQVPGSITWGTSLPRMYTVATFSRIADRREFTVISTHFDHESAAAQLKSARLLLTEVGDQDPDRPLIMMGDFNTGEDSEPYGVLTTGGLRDAFHAATERGPRLGTFNNYARPDPDGTRIDWILVSSAVSVQTARMVDTAPDGQYPSDHLPVEAIVTF